MMEEGRPSHRSRHSRHHADRRLPPEERPRHRRRHHREESSSPPPHRKRKELHRHDSERGHGHERGQHSSHSPYFQAKAAAEEERDAQALRTKRARTKPGEEEEDWPKGKEQENVREEQHNAVAAAHSGNTARLWPPLCDRLLFGPKQPMPKGSPAYLDFQDFFSKYLRYNNVLRAKQQQHKEEKVSDQEDERRSKEPLPEVLQVLPLQYDQRYRVNFSLTYGHMEQARHKTMTKEEEEALQLVRKALHLYHDFRQKQQFNQVLQVQRERAALPIAQYRDSILDAVRNSSVVILAGDTGCGKSTQVCQFLAEGGFGKIACTQPRRMAAMSLCRRVNYESLHVASDAHVAYQIRFESSKSPNTHILFLTEGVLLRQLAEDPLLMRYDVVIVDEVHERHIHADFLLGVLRALLMKRPTLKLVLMSATINIELFMANFEGAPVVQVPGRMYPVDVNYIPLQADEELLRGEERQAQGGLPIVQSETPIEPGIYLSIIESIDAQYPPSESGDLLIFVSGMSDILTLMDAIRPYAAQTRGWIVLPLHSALSMEEQDKVFAKAEAGVRKCVISTNISETALTISGIRFVIDSGKVKEMGYDPETKMSSLQTYWISRASAEQRKGRAGRTGPGVCFRLYSERAMQHFLPYGIPEIQRIPLEETLMQMLALGLGDPREFHFIERPCEERIEAALSSLQQQQLLQCNGGLSVVQTGDLHLTAMGQLLARLPVDIPIGKMLVLGALFHIIDPILTIAAALSVQSPFIARAKSSSLPSQSGERSSSYASPHGDAFTLMNVFDEWIITKANPKLSSKKWCRQHGLEEQRLYEMVAAKLKQQFKDTLLESGILDKKEMSELRQSDEVVLHTNRHHRRRQRHRPPARQNAYASKKRDNLQRARERKQKDRILSFEEEEDISEAEQNEKTKATQHEEVIEEELDVLHWDFLLRHDMSELVEQSCRELTLRDVNLIKIIIASGLFPHFAVGDENNASLKESDQIFHTKWKQFLKLHPTSVFYGQALQLIRPADVLCYVKLLETNKPYLTNIIRAPSLHSLLLFATQVDTSSDCSKFVIDNWLQIEFSQPKWGEKVLLVANQLRVLLRNLLHHRLFSASAVTRDDAAFYNKATLASLPEEVQHKLPSIILQIYHESTRYDWLCEADQLASKLADFLDTSVEFTLSRVKPTELTTLFVRGNEGSGVSHAPVQPKDAMQELEALQLLQTEGLENTKGGVRINEYLQYGSVNITQTALVGFSPHLRKHWRCEVCGRNLIATLQDVADHQAKCNPS